jgi:anti-sigma regulatory factor (Ser/Thr protein kinase)
VTTSTHLELRLPAVPSSIRKARAAAGEALEELHASVRLTDEVRLCVSEAVTNVVRHAYGREVGDFELLVSGRRGEVEVIVRDTGSGMPSIAPTPLAGGFGLDIIDKVASGMTVTDRNGAGTEVRMLFALADQSSKRRG